MNDNNGCEGCFWKRGYECVRFPPVVVFPSQTINGEWVPTQWGFPPSTSKCGEFAQEVKVPT